MMRHGLRGIVGYFVTALFIFTVSVQNAIASEWTLNLRDANIRAFVSQMADITGKTFVVDPRVKGKVTIISKTPMNAEDIYSLFQSAINVHGFIAMENEGVVKIIQQVDAKQSGGGSKDKNNSPEDLITKVISVEHTEALGLVPLLRPLVAKYGHLAGVKEANALIISDHELNIQRIEGLIDSLDKPVVEDTVVIQLKHAWVGDLVPVLQELGKNSSEFRSQQSSLSISADESGNRLVAHGSPEEIEKLSSLIRRLDQPVLNSGNMKVVELNHANAKELEEIIKGLMEGKSEAEAQTNFGVFADEGLNALVLRGDPSMIREVEHVVSQLDIRRAQVMIEAAIVEISDEAGESLGTQIAAGDRSGSSVPLVGTNFNNAGVDLNTILGSVLTGQVSGLSSGGTLGIGASRDNGVAWGVLVQALSQSTSADLLSTPSIITLDNKTSEIIVGQNVPFRTGQSSTAGDGLTNPFTTIERRDIGLSLKVTPSISKDGLVRLEVEQSTENVAPSIENASDIVTNKREIKTTVLADDGETIVLGGLIKDDYQVNVSKVPLLGDIPFVGRLFRSETETKTKRNLLVFLKPTIMRNKGDSIKATEYKYEGLREIDLGNFKGETANSIFRN